MLLEIQCLPSPLGGPDPARWSSASTASSGDAVGPMGSDASLEDDHYRHIEAAIAVIEQSGLTYEVGALGTTVEGEPDQIWALSRAVHEATLLSGADSCVSIIKVAQSRLIEDSATIDSLTSKFR